MPCKLLMIDDEPDHIRLVTEFLDADVYDLQATSDPFQGIELAKANPPALIILDIQMPKLDGFGVIDRLRKNEKLRDIPIVIYSIVGDEDENILRGLGLGVDHIVYKGRRGALRILEATIDQLAGAKREPVHTFRATGHELKVQGNADRVWLDGRELNLTVRQRAVLAELANARGKLVHTEVLRQLLYGKLLKDQHWKLDDKSRFYKFMHDLRKRVEPDPRHPIFIENAKDAGYRLMDDAT